MFTVVETLIFQRTWPHYWTEEERGEFCAYIATNHEVGDVVAQSGAYARFAGAAPVPANLAAFG